MRKLVMAGLIVVLLTLSLVGLSYAGDSAYDQASGTSGDSWHASQEASNPGSYDNLNSSWERARDQAGRGFDKERSSNLSGGGMQYISTPTPKIDKDASE